MAALGPGRAAAGGGAVLGRVERLGALAAVAVDRDGLGAQPPALEVGLLDLLDRGVLGHVDGLADRAGDERLGGAHHLDVAHVVDRALAVGRLEGAVEHRQVALEQVRRALDRLLLVDVGDDVVDLRGGVAELLERHRHRLVDDLHHPAADQLLVLDQRDVGLDAGGVAVHHEADGAGRREHGGLGVAVAEVLAELDRLVPRLPGAVVEVGRHVLGGDVLDRVAVLAHHAQERLAVDGVAGERPAVIAGDPRRLRVGLAGHQRGDRAGVVAAGVAVVGQAARHQQRAEVGVAEAERPVGVAVLLDRLGRVARVVDEDLLGGDQGAARRLEAPRRRTRRRPRRTSSG